MHDLFSFRSDALPETVRVVTFTGAEALSRPYRFDVHLLVPRTEDGDFDMASALNARATLSIHHDDGAPRCWFHGLISVLELTHELPDYTLYRAALVPRLHLLRQSRHSRVNVRVTIPDIIEGLLKQNGLSPEDDYVLQLARTYPEREHVCQYHESDLDFLSRWMEREGLYYFFEQQEDRERLVITDHRSFHEPLLDEPVRYFPLSKLDHDKVAEAFHAFACRHSALPAGVTLKDYDYLHPELEVVGSADVTAEGVGEVHSFGEHFRSPEEGTVLAAVRAQEVQARQVLHQARGRVFGLRPGYTFELEGHPRAAFNAEYLTVELRHRGQQLEGGPELRGLLDVRTDDAYQVDAVALPAEIQFRPERVTPTPRIYGMESAIIDGEDESEYAQLDEYGRYLVRVMFDEEDSADGQASTRVRMLQPHGGTREGFHFPLRKGTEVLLVFLGGDPDRPVIAGVVPNPLRPSPVTSSNASLNVVQTGGENRIEIEDTDGAQYMTLATPHENTMLHMGAPNVATHNIQARTDGNCCFAFGTDWDVTVGGHLDEAIEGDVSEAIGGNRTTEIGGDDSELVQGSRSTGVVGDVDETIGGSRQVDVGGNVSESIGGARNLDVSGEDTEQYHGDRNLGVDGNMLERYGGDRLVTNTGTVKEMYLRGQGVHVAGGQRTIVQSSSSTAVLGGMSVAALPFYMVNTDLLISLLGICVEAAAVKVGLNGVDADLSVLGVSLNEIRADLSQVQVNLGELKLGMAELSLTLEMLTIFI